MSKVTSAGLSLTTAVGANDPVIKSDFDTALGLKVDTSLLGANNGVATLDSGGKVPTSQLPSSVAGSLNYKGVWNANTNSPALSDSAGGGVLGDYYKVSVAGTTSVDGNASWHVGDLIINDGTQWDKIDNYEAVVSVAGKIGAVTLDTGDVSEGSRLYYTDARAIAAPLTGYTSGAGSVASTDSILQAIQKLNGNDALKELLANKDTDGTLSANSDTKYASQKATKTYVDTGLATKAASFSRGQEVLTLGPTDISNGYIDLAHTILSNSLDLSVQSWGGLVQTSGVDYTLSTVSSKTRVTFAGDMASLVSGNVLQATYQY